MLFAFLAPALAVCVLDQASLPDGVAFRVTADGQAAPCRDVWIRAAGDEAPRAFRRTVDGKKRVKSNHIARVAGGAWHIVVPELQVGEPLEITVVAEGQVGISVGSPLPAGPAPTSTDIRWVLAGAHPGWGFADPRLGSTLVEARWSLDGEAATFLPIPPTATVSRALDVFVAPGSARAAAGVTLAEVAWIEAGASPQGRIHLENNRVSLGAPGVELAWTASPGVRAVMNGEVLVAEGSGTLSYRVKRVSGEAVIPDVSVFWAGIQDRFRRASLPEPAVPLELKRIVDRSDMETALFTVVGGSTLASLPGHDPMAPRPLNRAWKSGFTSRVERGLILHMLLSQERVASGYVLAGPDVDPETFTGFDAVLVQTKKGWLDPGCSVCAPGELSPRYAGQPALSADGWVSLPEPSGRVARSILVEGADFIVDFRLEGASATSLRERLAEVEPGQRSATLARVLGMVGANVESVTGLEMPDPETPAAEMPAVVVSARLRGPNPPRPPEVYLPSGGRLEVLGAEPTGE